MKTELLDFLTAQGLQQYFDAFNGEGFEDVEGLRGLMESDLEKLGLRMAHRKKLLRALGASAPDDPGSDGSTRPPAPSDGAAVPPTDSPPAEALRPLNLFISYGRDEFKDEAAALASELKRRGHSVWFDQQALREGLAWELAIEQGLRDCEWVILLMTPHSVRRPDGFCLREITKAAELNKKIIPLLVRDIPGGAPLLICNVQYLDWRSAVPSSRHTQRFQQLIGRLCEAVEHGRLDFEGAQGSLARHLRPMDFMRDQVDRASGFVGRQWLLDEVGRWLGQESSRLFWLSGGPGIGKSAFSAHLCQTCPDVKARHFCVHNHDDRGDPRKALLSIVYQLSQQIPEYAQLLGEVDLKEEAAKSTTTIFDNLVVRLLDRVPRPDRPYVVVIDAIDEASRNGNNEIAGMIRDHWSQTPVWLRLLITSRPESEVLNRLNAFEPWVLDARRPENLEDLRLFLGQGLVRLGLQAEDAVLENILERSEGIFLYARLVLEEFKGGHLSLDRIDALPRGMSGFYSSFFDRKFKEDLTRYQTQWRQALGVILASREPLPVEILARAMGWRSLQLHDFATAFGSLLEYRGEGAERVIQPFHKSLPDWLADPRQSGPYFASLDEGHSLLAGLEYASIGQGGDNFLTEGKRTPLRDPSRIYLQRHFAVHAALAGRPCTGAAFLARRGEVSSQGPGIDAHQFREAVDAYLESLNRCTDQDLTRIESVHLANLVNRTDSKTTPLKACDLLLDRASEWAKAFAAHPFARRGAMWTFAVRWASRILKQSGEHTHPDWLLARDIAIDGGHPLFLPAAYTFKYVAVQRLHWLDLKVLEPICTGWTYSRLVATNLLMQAALNGNSLAEHVPWMEFWDPPWEYNCVEIRLLKGALHWRTTGKGRGLLAADCQIFTTLEANRIELSRQPDISDQQRAAVDHYWNATVDLERTTALLQGLDRSDLSKEILLLYLASPLFEASEAAAGVITDRFNEDNSLYSRLLGLARPESLYAWGAFAAAAKMALVRNESDRFFALIERYSLAQNAQLRGLAAMNLASWVRDASDQELVAAFHREGLFGRFLLDEDIWPFQEIFHLLAEIKERLSCLGVEWSPLLDEKRAPILQLVPNWRDLTADWRGFEAAATSGKLRQIRGTQG